MSRRKLWFLGILGAHVTGKRWGHPYQKGCRGVGKGRYGTNCLAAICGELTPNSKPPGQSSGMMGAGLGKVASRLL